MNRIYTGLTFGGSSARGIGFAKIIGDAAHKQYDLSSIDDHCSYLDDHRNWRQNADFVPDGVATIEPKSLTEKSAKIKLMLGIPRGQDLLVGDGQGVDHAIEPQRVVGVDGETYWRVPGASLRGAFKSWISRLAARDGVAIADSLEKRHDEPDDINALTGNNLGWCFLPDAPVALDDDESSPLTCPIASLFGSLLTAGRIHIADAITLSKPKHDNKESPLLENEQLRKHVAVDRITGGAAESMLFKNTVLAHSEKLKFEVVILIKNPTEQELEWLRKTIIAMDLGVLRIGSSKSSGRLALMEPPKVEGTTVDNAIGDITPDGWAYAQA